MRGIQGWFRARLRAFLVSWSVLVGFLSLGTPADAQVVEASVSSYALLSSTFANVPGGSLIFTPANPSEVWIVLLSAKLSNSSTAGRSAELRYLVNGVERGLGGANNNPVNNPDGWQHFYPVTGTATAQTVQVQIRALNAGATATVEDLQIVAFRLPTGADFQYAEWQSPPDPDPVTVPIGFVNIAPTLTFTPSSSGDYMIMAVATGHEDPGSSFIGVRLRDPTGTFWPVDHDIPDSERGHFSNGRRAWRTFFFARVQNLDTTSKTYAIQATGDVGGPNAEMRYHRIMAFRTDVFETVDSAQAAGDLADQLAPATTPTVKSVVTTAAPPGPRDYIVIQSLGLHAAGNVTESRNAGFEVDDVVQMSATKIHDGGELSQTYTRFDGHTTASSVKFENTFWTSNLAHTVFAKESVIHVLRLPTCSPVVNFRSIGTNTGTLASGPDASITAGSNSVTFGSGSLPATVGVGDQLVIGAETFFISARLSGTNVIVQTPATMNHASVAYTITRAYSGATAMQDWETAREGDLVGENRREVGVAYNDSPFNSALWFEDSITDSCRYLHLTVAQGQRHSGVAGTGAIVDGLDTAAGQINIRNHFTRVDGLELTRTQGAGDASVRVQNVTDVLLEDLLIYDTGVGIRLSGVLDGMPGHFTARNCVVYDADVYGIEGDESEDFATIENCTVYNSLANDGIASAASNFTVRNTISMNNASLDFDITTGTQSYNISSDASAAGTGSSTGLSAANQFVSIAAGSEDFHLKAGADAIDQGFDFAAGFSNDIDAEPRPLGAQWDIGADERPTGACPGAMTGWYDQHWQYRKALVIDPSKVNSPLQDFPVLVNLATDADLAADAQNSGNDLVFTASDRVTKLSHEIETFDGGTGALVAWVKVPYLSSGADTTLYLYYGNATVGDQQDAVNVWDPSFVGVWHLKEDPGPGAPDDIKNSESGINHGTAQTSMTTTDQVSGQINGSIDFDGTNDYIRVPDDPTLQFGTGGLTASAWIRPTAASSDRIANNRGVGVPGTTTGWQFKLNQNGANWELYDSGIEDGTGTFAGCSAAACTSTFPFNQWHHVAMVYDADNELRFFVNGNRDNTIPVGPFGDISNSLPTVIGASLALNGVEGTRDQEFQGTIDEVRLSNVARSDDWIAAAYENQFQPGSFMSVCSATTAVELTAFEADARDSAVELRWETATELDNLGFHLYRSTSAGGAFERITERVIPGLGSSPAGATYLHRDTGLTNGVAYFYKLEDIDAGGVSTFHGPVSATPLAGAPTGQGDDDGVDATEDDGGTTRITYGDPSANVLRIVKEGPGFVVLELETDGFYAEPLEDGSVRIEVPDFVAVGGPDAPEIPVKRRWVDAVAGRTVKLVSVKAQKVESFSGLRPADGDLSEIVAHQNGTVRARRRRSRGARAAFRGRGLYPTSPAQVVSVGFQGETKKALLELAPIRWDPSAGRLLLAKRLVVRLSFRGRDLEERSRRSRHRGRSRLLARLATRERGLHVVSYDNLFGRAKRPLRVDRLRLSRHDEDVPFHVEPDARHFGSGSWLYFVSDGADANPYGSEAVYELSVGSPGTSMSVGSGAPHGDATTFYWQRREHEENHLYQAALVDAPDPWLWDLVFAPETKRYPFDVSALATVPEAGRIELWLQGASDSAASPDHHVRVYVNGSLVHELSWNGKRARRVATELPPGILVEGMNELALQNVGDTGASYSMVMLDRFAVTYPRVPVADGDELEGRWENAGVAELSGFPFGAYALDVTEPTPRWLTHLQIDASGTLRFRAESGSEYLAVGPDALLHPSIQRPKRTPLRRRRNRADYVVLGPRAFLEAAAPLLALRRSQGLKVQAVAVEDVYSEFGFGESRPEAIREFLEYAYHEWRAPSLRYVVLLGDGTYDFKDYTKLGSANPVPPMMVKTSYLWTASDPAYAAIHGDDLLPDIAIGRLPAASVADVEAMVEKILVWESNQLGLDGPAVLVADNPDRAGDFVASAEAAARSLPSTTDLTRIYLSELGASESRAAIVDAFDRGAALMSYIGHGGIHLWADENVFDTNQLSAMTSQARQPFLLTMNCLNGYFHFPYFDSLAEELLKAEDKGVIAAFSPSGLSLNAPAQRFHEAMLEELTSGTHARLGDAVLAAQERYLETGLFPELLSIYHLFGDPALVLR